MIPIPDATIAQFWAFLQILVRLSTVVAVAPVFGAREAPSQVKVGLTLILALALTPVLASTLERQSGIPLSLYGMAAVLGAQAAVGLVMGFAASLILMAYQMAGAILDLQVGFTMAQSLNPTVGDLESPLTQFQYYYALLLFLLANGHHILLMAFAKSFELVPALAANLSSGGALKAITDLTFGALVDGVKVAAPIAAVLLVLDICFALMSRALPQLNVFFVGMPAKVIAGLMLLGVVLPAAAIYAGELVSGQPGMLYGLLQSLHHA